MPDSLGDFSADPQATWLVAPGRPGDLDDRDMVLLREFWFKDPAGKTWRAPQGSVVNGASIPAALWSIVGSPYTGPYRRASIVHDVACDEATQEPDPIAARTAADHMFRQACRAGGCSEKYADLLYVGVCLGKCWLVIQPGPQPQAQALLATGRLMPDVQEESICTTYREIAADLQRRSRPRTFEELEALVSRHLEAKARQYGVLLVAPLPLPRRARRSAKSKA